MNKNILFPSIASKLNARVFARFNFQATILSFITLVMITFFGILFLLLNAQLIQIQNFAENDTNNCSSIVLSNFTRPFFCDLSEIGISTKYSCSSDYYIQYTSFESGSIFFSFSKHHLTLLLLLFLVELIV